MTQKETSVLLGMLRVAYPRFYAEISPEDVTASVSTWTMMLSDTTLEVATAALQRLIATSKFPPTIAEMRESIAAVQYPTLPDAGDAWGEVNDAIRNYGYYRQAEALASMREPVHLAVERMGWRDLCMSENGMADRAHFLRIYESMEKRTKEQNLLPTVLKETITIIGQAMTSGTDKPLLATSVETSSTASTVPQL